MTDIEKKPQKEIPDLYKRSIKGGFWVFALRFATQGLGFVKSIIVVNCLMLENLGLIAIAIMLMEILNTFSESGFNAALVQKKEDVSDYLDTAWVISIVRGILLFTILYFTAPLFASFKVSDESIPLAINIIRVMGLCMLIQGFRNIGVVYFQKDMEFHKTFWMQLAGTLTDIVLSITLVVIYRSVWGYVIARLVSACVGLVLSYLVCPYRPKFHFIPAKAKELWKFGKWIFGSNILGFLLEQGDDFFVWFYLGLPQLALYRYAFRFSNMPATHISQVISQVSFPAYSKIQHDLPRLREAYLKTLKITALFSVPITFLIFILGPDFVHLFLPERMWSMCTALQILAFYGLFKSAGVTRGGLFRSTNNHHVLFYYHWVRIFILAATIYPLTKLWGITGTAVAVLLPPIFVNPLGVIFASKMLNCPILKILQQTALFIIVSILMAIPLILFRFCLGPEISMFDFSALISLAFILYFSLLWLFDHYTQTELRLFFSEQLQFIIKLTKSRKEPANDNT